MLYIRTPTHIYTRTTSKPSYRLFGRINGSTSFFFRMGGGLTGLWPGRGICMLVSTSIQV